MAAESGVIPQQVRSSDAYLKFVENEFVGGQRLDPRTDGRRDSRTNVREKAKILGNLANNSQKPGSPVLLPLHPPFS